MRAWRRRSSVLALSALMLAGLPSLASSAWGSETFYVSPSGSDGGAGTRTAPWRSLHRALEALRPGQTLLVRGGTYAEQVTSADLAPGTSTARIRVLAYPGERPVVQGLLWLKNASHWDVAGINVTWSDRNASDDHLVKMTGGQGWTLTDAEIWGARSFAALLVAGGAADWTVARNYIHDTHPTNGTNQDHLVYANSSASGGIIERNILEGSRNGRAVKVGPPTAGAGRVRGLAIRYNTMASNWGPSNVQLAYDTSDVRIYRNILVDPAPGRSAITAYALTGSGNVVSDNLVWDAARPVDAGVRGLSDGGGNIMLDPQLRDAGGQHLLAHAPAAAGYGRHAGQTTVPEPAAPAAPVPSGPAVPITERPALPVPEVEPSGVPVPPSTAPTTDSPGEGIAFRGASTATNQSARDLLLRRPVGTTPGDVLLASVDVRGRPVVDAPQGWALVDLVEHGTTMRKATYWRVAVEDDPASWTWGFSAAQNATGVMVAPAASRSMRRSGRPPPNAGTAPQRPLSPCMPPHQAWRVSPSSASRVTPRSRWEPT